MKKLNLSDSAFLILQYDKRIQQMLKIKTFFSIFEKEYNRLNAFLTIEQL